MSMDFNFSDEEQDFRRAVRDWVSAKYPKAKVNELERHEDHDGSNFPYAFFDDLASAGFLGVGIDESLGGQGGGATMQAILMDELARNLAGLTWVWGISSFCAKSIQKFAGPEIREEFVPAMVAGEKKVAIAITEPGGGTDLLGAMITRATREDGGYLISGAKIWSTMAHVSDYLLLLAKTSDGEKSSHGKTLFLVPTDQDGVVARPIPKLGMRCVGSCEVQLEDAFVPESHVIGEIDRGWYHILTTLNNERILVAALATGVLRGVMEDAVAYAKERRAFGHSIGDFQIIQHWIAEMAMKLAQAELLTYKAAWLYDTGHDAAVESSMAKAIAAEYATWAADRGIQILGGMGYAAEFDMQRYWRDVRLYQIGPVTNEMVRNIIAQHLGLERSF
ncbi:MAG: acyl-CoA/acyl-ACP dehydrogenase [Solirubrobacterales bacterium]|nr:acyl-CoA/acyl-ACP dehydrogenase [Solirubrobacterales bacterium]